MAYETIPITVKDAGRVHMLTGTVTGTGDGTADVDIDDYGVASDIPTFYHCPDSETADGNPFSIDDRVLIVNSGSALNPVIANMKVIGFEDGLPRECGFQIKLTRGDGTLITEDSGLFSYFDIWDKDWNWYETTTPVYTPVLEDGIDVNGYWSFELVSPDPNNEDGYWLLYACTDGITTQYPYKYKDADKYNEDDLLVLKGFHEDIIPYWVIGDYYTLPIPEEKIGGNCAQSPEVWLQYDMVLGFLTSVSRNRIIKSSVPYKVRAAFWSQVYWYGDPGCSGATCEYTPNPIGVLITSSSDAVDGALVCADNSLQTISGDSDWQELSISGKEESIIVTFNGDNTWTWNEVTYSYRRSIIKHITRFTLTFLYE